MIAPLDISFLFAHWLPLEGGALVLAWWPLIALVPLVWLVWRYWPKRRDAGAVALGIPGWSSFEMDARGAPGEARRFPWLAALAWLMLLFSAARPQWLGEPVGLPNVARDLMLAVDISGSMGEPDYMIGARRVSRLDAVKVVAGRFLEERVGDRLGLILFGSRAYLQAPLTLDRKTVKALLFEADVGMAGKATAIGDAIGMAIKRLRDLDTEHKVLILLTDGQNTAGAVRPDEAARLAAEAGIRIYTIGLSGGDQGGFFGLLRMGSDLDEGLLKRIAEVSGGRYFKAADASTLADIYHTLDELEPRQADEQVIRPVHEWYRFPLMLSVGLWLLAAIMPLARSLTGRSGVQTHG